MPKRFVLDEISYTLTPYGPIDTNESERNIEEDSHNDQEYEKLLKNENLVNLQIKTRTPTNLTGTKYDSRQFFEQQENQN